MSRILSLLVFVGLVAAVAFAAGMYMPGAWYAALAKPSWTPPNWLFGPVWAVLYLMIAIAGWLVWQAEGTSLARWLWPVQLALNGLWSPVMFGSHLIGWALVVIIAMWLTIAGFVWACWRPQRIAALLFLPYLVWVSYASALNAALWRMNG